MLAIFMVHERSKGDERSKGAATAARLQVDKKEIEDNIIIYTKYSCQLIYIPVRTDTTADSHHHTPHSSSLICP